MIGEPVGRDREIGFLDAFLDQPDQGLRIAVLAGDAGIGKSTLWQWTVEAAHRRHLTVLTSRPAETERGLPNLVLGDLFRGIDPSQIALLPAPRRRALEAALLIGEASDVAVDRRALGDAVATVLHAMARQQTLLIAIDDDQWIDSSSAETLAFALRRLGDQPIRLVLARRSRGRPAVRLDSVGQGVPVSRLDIGPLSVGATQLLLRDRLGVSLPRPTLRELHRVSAGNPFHALELGRARSQDGSRDLALPLAEVTTSGLLRARLRELDAPTNAALLLVAAHGRTPIELLVSLDVPTNVIQEAIDANLLERSGNVIGFSHPLVAAAVYDGARGEVRRTAHQRLAAAIDDPVQRGRHLGLSAAGPDEAISAELEAASRDAHGRGQLVAAAHLAERAVALTPDGDVESRQRRMLAAAQARLGAGEGDRARALLTSLIDDAPTGSRRAEALLLASELEGPTQAVALLDDALRAASSDRRLRAVVHAALAAVGRLTRGRSWAWRHLEASLRLSATLDDHALQARAMAAAAILRFEGTDPRAHDVAQEAYRLALIAKDDVVLREATTTIAHLLTWAGDTKRARAWLTDQLAVWRDRDEMLQADCLWYLALVEFRAGRWDIADERAAQSFEIRTQYGVEVPTDHMPAALVALHRGDFDLARQHSDRAMSLAGRMLVPAHLAVHATIELWTGNPGRAITWFDQAEAAADTREWEEPAMRFWRAEYGEALLRAGRIDEAVKLVVPWETLAARVGRDRELAGAIRVRGLIASASGDLTTAGMLLEDAAARHDAAGDPFGGARARLAQGVAHRRLRRKRLARQAFESAATAFEALGASSWVAEVRTELARLGGRTRIEGMSPSERRVAELVAEGRSNRDIAAELFLTERTVASHLTHLYSKLGVRSRTQLARLISEGASKVPQS